MRRARAAGITSLTVAAAATAFAVLGHSGRSADPRADLAALRASVRTASALGPGAPARLIDILPNVTKDVDGSTSTDSVVVGTISSVVGEAGYEERYIPNTPRLGHPGARVTGFDDPQADWRTLRLTIDVEETLAGPRAERLEVSWSLGGNNHDGDDADAIGRALKALGRVVVLSTAQSSDPAYLGIKRNVPGRESCLLQVAADGTLTAPLAGGSHYETPIPDPAAFLEGAETLDKLRAQVAKPKRPYPTR